MFLFRIILELKKSWKDNTEHSHVFHNSGFHIVNIIHYYSVLVTTHDSRRTLPIKLYTYPDFLCFCLMSFHCLRIPSRTHITFSCHASCLVLAASLTFLIFWQPWEFWGVLIKYFIDCSLTKVFFFFSPQYVSHSQPGITGIWEKTTK